MAFTWPWPPYFKTSSCEAQKAPPTGCSIWQAVIAPIPWGAAGTGPGRLCLPCAGQPAVPLPKAPFMPAEGHKWTHMLRGTKARAAVKDLSSWLPLPVSQAVSSGQNPAACALLRACCCSYCVAWPDLHCVRASLYSMSEDCMQQWNIAIYF